MQSSHPIEAEAAEACADGGAAAGSGAAVDGGACGGAVSDGGAALADRIAEVLAPRGAGWRLPRRGALARKYRVSQGEIDIAIGALIRSAILRRLPDGQLYRASPADLLIPVEGWAGLATRLDPMGNAIICQQREVSRCQPPGEVADVLGIPPDAQVSVVTCTWAGDDGEPVAVSAAYWPAGSSEASGPDAGRDEPDAGRDESDSWDRPDAMAARAVRLQVGAAAPEVARTLTVTPRWPVVTVTVAFEGPDGRGVAVVTLRAELFRVSVESTPVQDP